MSRAYVPVALALGLTAVLLGQTPYGAEPGSSPGAAAVVAANKSGEPADEIDVLGSNAGCYVCHTTFVKEDLAKVHLKEKVGCVKCHGPSEKHANDENIGASKPDIIYPRARIDASCIECHKTHNVPAKMVLARFVERKLPEQADPVCTDCHGTHKVERSQEAASAPK